MSDFPICPRCKEPVHSDPHELRLLLVNAPADAPKEATDISGTFHHECAARVWNLATEAWWNPTKDSADGIVAEEVTR